MSRSDLGNIWSFNNEAKVNSWQHSVQHFPEKQHNFLILQLNCTCLQILYNTIGNIVCIPSGQALCLYAAHETEDLHSVSPGLGEHAPNSEHISFTKSLLCISWCVFLSPGSWAGSEELVPVDVCSSHSLHPQHQLWPPPTDAAPHEYSDVCGDRCAGIAGSA